MEIKFGNAICYSGYREEQSPLNQTYPSYEQICEDLGILEGNWQYLRLYDCSRHAELVLEARKSGLIQQAIDDLDVTDRINAAEISDIRLVAFVDSYRDTAWCLCGIATGIRR